jgi:glutaredoxin 3
MLTTRFRLLCLGFTLACFAFLSSAFLPTPTRCYHYSPVTLNAQTFAGSNEFLNGFQTSFRIFRESLFAGNSISQTLANVLAGEYDEEAVKFTINTIVDNEPCVMFTWERSPSCVSALKALAMTGAKFKNVRLDDPWQEGNPVRAELGKMVGRSSVPCIFIGGKYVGGYDAGPSDATPGIVVLAFQGTLRQKLEEAGAL